MIFTPKYFSRDQIELVRGLKSLKWIDVNWSHWNNAYSDDPSVPHPCTSAETFWKHYDAGDYSK